MSVLFRITSGWTGRLGPFTLLVDNVPFELTGLTVVPVIRRPDGETFVNTGVTTKDPDQVTYPGRVYYDPLSTDFVWDESGPIRQPYRIHWRVTDAFGKVMYFPSGEADEISVHQA